MPASLVNGKIKLIDLLPDHIKKKLYGDRITVKNEKLESVEISNKPEDVEIVEVKDLNLDIID